MVKFSAIIMKFGQQGEKTGWTYILIPAATAKKINPGVKVIYRVKGKLDELSIVKTALMPMGEGDFILPLNASMRKKIAKGKGAVVKAELEVDNAPILPSTELLDCLADEPEAMIYYNSLPQSHRNYFTKWIDSAKTDQTKTKRIALVIKSLLLKMNFGEMLRAEKAERNKLSGP